jgi:hypothetical protein
MEYVIAIPTYKRGETLKNKTLKMLENENINKDNVYIFFANENELKEYNLIGYKNLIVGELGLINQRNFIVNYFNQNQKILWLDDDLSCIKTVEKDINKLGKKFDNKFKDATINEFAILGFNELEKNQCSLFGLYPVNNDAFLTIGNVTTDLKYIIGCCYGTINNRELFTFDVNESNGGAKEDFLRTLMVYEKEKKVVRLNFFTAITNYYGEKGGLQSLEQEYGNRKERDFISMKYICDKYKGLAFENINKKGYPEIKLKDTLINKIENQITLF